MARWAMKRSGAAPCQWFSPGSKKTRSPHQRHEQRQDEEGGGGGQRGRDAIGEQLARSVAGGAGSVEDGDENAQPERPAEVMSHVDQSAGYASVLCGNAGHAAGGQR